MSIKDVYQAVIDLDKDIMPDLVKKELEAGTDINSLLHEGLIAPMDYVGKQFSAGELFVPEMLLAAQTMKVGLEILKPHLGSGGSSSAGKIVIGTV
jgi:5-methyltetrahydrofolate--homocysteine methyltransferase